MIEEIKILLGDSAGSYTDAQIELAAKNAIIEVESYCGRVIDAELEVAAMKMAVVNLNRQGSEGMASQSYSGVSETYVNGYPEEIMAVLRRKRKIKVV